jgi:beta-mannanase
MTPSSRASPGRSLLTIPGTDPIYVRTAWELGGEWYHWTAAAKSDPTAFIDAFRHFADSFHSVSSRFKIVWDVVADRGPVEQWYPGDAHVDVIGQDVYWHPQWNGTDPNAAFEVHKSGMEFGLDWIASFAAQHNKAIAIPEWGVPGDNASTMDGARFADLMQQWIATHKVAFADYWDSTSNYNGLVSDNQPAKTATEVKAIFIDDLSF